MQGRGQGASGRGFSLNRGVTDKMAFEQRPVGGKDGRLGCRGRALRAERAAGAKAPRWECVRGTGQAGRSLRDQASANEDIPRRASQVIVRAQAFLQVKCDANAAFRQKRDVL